MSTTMLIDSTERQTAPVGRRPQSEKGGERQCSSPVVLIARYVSILLRSHVLRDHASINVSWHGGLLPSGVWEWKTNASPGPVGLIK